MRHVKTQTEREKEIYRGRCRDREEDRERPRETSTVMIDEKVTMATPCMTTSVVVYE